MTPPVELPRRELALPLRRSMPLWLPVILAGAIGIGFGISGGLHGARILLCVVGLAGLVLAAVAMLRPPTLVLDAGGLALRTPLGERWRSAWTDCEEFRVWQRHTVVWDSPAEVARRPRSAVGWRKRTGADAGVPAQFGGLTAVDLAALLNRYRTAASLTAG